MKVKVFHLRLTKDNLQSDQDILNDFLETITVKKTSNELITTTSLNYWSILVFYEEKKVITSEKNTDKFSIKSEDDLSAEEHIIYNALKKWRQERANLLEVPSYIIAHNTELMTIAKLKPETIDDLIKIKGFGGQKAAKYGEDIIALLNSI